MHQPKEIIKFHSWSESKSKHAFCILLASVWGLGREGERRVSDAAKCEGEGRRCPRSPKVGVVVLC